MTTTVRIPWTRKHENTYYWNEVCAWAIEYFGLPGDRFETHANVNYMDFVFKDNRDALIMALMWNATVIDDQELCVEFVGNMINS